MRRKVLLLLPNLPITITKRLAMYHPKYGHPLTHLTITQSYIRLMNITLPSSPATIWEVTPTYQNTSTYSGRLPRRSTQPTWNKTITSSLKLTLIRLTQVIKKAIFASHADYELKIVWNFQTHTTLLFSVGITFSKWHKYIFRKMAKRGTTNRWVNVTSSFSS